MLYEKLLFLDETHVGTTKEEIKDEAMLKAQEELTK
jgi:hypothetical protein